MREILAQMSVEGPLPVDAMKSCDDAAWESVIEHGIPDRVGIALVASIGSLVF